MHKLDLLRGSPRSCIADGPSCLLAHLKLRRGEQLDQRGDEVGIEDTLQNNRPVKGLTLGLETRPGMLSAGAIPGHRMSLWWVKSIHASPKV